MSVRIVHVKSAAAAGTAPTDIFLSSNTVPENNAINYIIGALTDDGSGSVSTYTLASGVGDTDNDSFNILSNFLRASEEFNFEGKDTYSIRVRAENDAGNGEEIFEITVTDVDEIAPSLNSLSISDVAIETATLNVNFNEACTIRWGVWPSIQPEKTYSQIISGTGAIDNGSIATAGNMNETDAIEGLTVSTANRVHLFAEDAAGNRSDVMLSNVFITNSYNSETVVAGARQLDTSLIPQFQAQVYRNPDGTWVTRYSFNKNKARVLLNSSNTECWVEKGASGGGDGSELSPYNNFADALSNGFSIINVPVQDSLGVDTFYISDNIGGAALPDRDILIRAIGGVARLTTAPDPSTITWSPEGSANVYETDAAITGSDDVYIVVDESNLDENGIMKYLEPVGSIAEVSTTLNSFYFNSGTRIVYARTFDDRVPDGDILCLTDQINTQTPSNATLVLENIHAIGGSHCLRLASASEQFLGLTNCRFHYGAIKDNVYITSRVRGFARDCRFDYAIFGDGINYINTIGAGEVPGQLLEFRNRGSYFGILLVITELSNNGSTGHQDYDIIQMNCQYTKAQGRVQRDIDRVRRIAVSSDCGDPTIEDGAQYSYSTGDDTEEATLELIECRSQGVEGLGVEVRPNSVGHYWDGDNGNIGSKTNSVGGTLNVLSDSDVFIAFALVKPRVDEANPDRILFDTNRSITGSTATGFSVTNRTVTGININSNSKTGHYLTINSALTSLQLEQIAYSGGSDIEALDGDILPTFSARDIRPIIDTITSPIIDLPCDLINMSDDVLSTTDLVTTVGDVSGNSRDFVYSGGVLERSVEDEYDCFYADGLVSVLRNDDWGTLACKDTFSISMDIKMPEGQNGTQYLIFYEPTSLNRVRLAIQDDGVVQVLYRRSTQLNGLSPAGTIPAGKLEWTNIQAAWVDNGDSTMSVKLRINGADVTLTPNTAGISMSTFPAGNNDLEIPQGGSLVTRGFNGYIKNIKMVAREFTTEEIAALAVQ